MLDKTIKLEYNIDIDEKKGCFCIENDLDYIIYLPKGTMSRQVYRSNR